MAPNATPKPRFPPTLLPRRGFGLLRWIRLLLPPGCPGVCDGGSAVGASGGGTAWGEGLFQAAALARWRWRAGWLHGLRVWIHEAAAAFWNRRALPRPARLFGPVRHRSSVLCCASLRPQSAASPESVSRYSRTAVALVPPMMPFSGKSPSPGVPFNALVYCGAR